MPLPPPPTGLGLPSGLGQQLVSSAGDRVAKRPGGSKDQPLHFLQLGLVLSLESWMLAEVGGLQVAEAHAWLINGRRVSSM